MKVQIDDVLVYNDSRVASQYGTGVVASITPDEYAILWSGRGLIKYRRSILDGKLGDIFQRVERRASIPKQRHLLLGASKVKVAFNENYDRAKIELLCEKLRASNARGAKDVADGLAAELFTKKLALREAAKAVLLRLAELCSAHNGAAYDDACSISREIFFGYVIQKSDFIEVEK
jgi:hypothetical protein